MCAWFRVVIFCPWLAFAAPQVNGLFYGDRDHENYPQTPYAVSTSGSRLYLSYVNGTVYAALVVARGVSDNVFDESLSAYMHSAGWENRPTTAGHRCNSEFAEFTLKVVCGTVTNQWTWQQGYAGQKGGGSPESRNVRTKASWRSDTTVSGGGGEPPPNLVSASSLMWNMNTYAAMLNGGTNTWVMPGADNNSASWKSPWNPENPDSVVNPAEGYPENGELTYSPTYRWEWPVVYEWSVDLTQFGASPTFVVTGRSHHSPRKTTNETDDPFVRDGELAPLMDFGDLPDEYGTLAETDGARHVIDPAGARLGNGLDSEPDGQPHLLALGDDGGPFDDEDGVELLSPLIPGGQAVLRVTVGHAGYLSAFIDWNEDGELDAVSLANAEGPSALPAGPLTELFVTNGVYELTIAVPDSAAGTMPARFRMTNLAGQGGGLPAGLAASGEVEDYVWTASVGNRVWLDGDGDGVQDPDETGLPGVTVRLVSPSGSEIARTETDADGIYTFVGLLPGAYRVAFEPAGNYLFSPRKAPDSACETDSDADPGSGQTHSFSLLPGQENQEIDAGLFEPAAIFGHVFLDGDGDLVRGAGDAALSNVLVRLMVNGATSRSTQTDETGHYVFRNVPAGTVTVLVASAAGRLVDVPEAGPSASDVRRNRAKLKEDGDAYIEKAVTSGYGVNPANPAEPLNFGFATYPLSASIDVQAYATGHGDVRLDVWTVNESGCGDIVIFAWIAKDWSEVGRVPASEVIGEGSNHYVVNTQALPETGSFHIRVLDESGLIHQLPGVLKVKSIRMRAIRVGRETVELTFETEHGHRYLLKSCEDPSNPASVWRTELASVRNGQAWSTFRDAPFFADVGDETVVRVIAGRPRAFFKVVLADDE